MQQSAPKPPLALIAGPTASGKSDVAVRLALALVAQGRSAVIVNADSAQVYADLAVLSARPFEEEMQGIEHRLFGTWDGAQACSAADWAAAARGAIAEVHAQGGVPVLVGGTGLYIRTLLDGIAPIPAIDPAVRDTVRAMATGDAYAALRREDPARAAMLAPADSTRIARSLEVVRSTGQTLADWQASKTGGIGGSIALHPLILLPPREALYARCNQRFAGMLIGGSGARLPKSRPCSPASSTPPSPSCARSACPRSPVACAENARSKRPARAARRRPATTPSANTPGSAASRHRIGGGSSHSMSISVKIL